MAKSPNKKHSFAAHFASLHIKKNTASRSNELSLSVLDALSSQASDKQASPGTTQPLGGVSLFTLENNKKQPIPTPSTNLGVTGVLGGSDKKADTATKSLDLSMAASAAAKDRAASLPDPEKEIARRKRKRRMRQAFVIAVVLSVLAAVGTVVGSYVYTQYQNQQTFVGQLSSGIEELMAADEVIVRIDELLAQSVTDDDLQDVEKLLQDVTLLTPVVEEAQSSAHDAAVGMHEGMDKQAAEQADAAAQARVTMLTEAQSILQVRIQAVQSANKLQEAASLVFKADTLAKEATALIVDTTPENTQASQKKTQEALDCLTAAQTLLKETEECYSSVDYSIMTAYVDKRIEAMGYAIASDEAIYVQDKATAEKQNELYNTAEREAIDLAKKLPKNTGTLVVQSYESDTAESMTKYLEARNLATTTDAFLRDYVGTSSDGR